MESENRVSVLFQLAPEILEQILGLLLPNDLVSFGRTCSKAHSSISPRNQLLWRSSFLQAFDDPRVAWQLMLPTARARNAKVESEWDWYREVQKRYNAFKAVTSNEVFDRRQNYDDSVAAVVDMIDTAPRSTKSRNLPLLLSVFESSKITEAFIHDFHPDRESPSLSLAGILESPGRPFTRSMTTGQDVSERTSRLHILYGITQRERNSRAAKGNARCLVYDWSLTGPAADYGPYKQDKSGQIHWKVLEAVYSVIVRNFELVTNRRIHFPQGFEHNVPAPSNWLKSKDWAKIEGSWLGTYSFLDYTDLFHYNIAYRPGPRPPLDDHVEACGDLMRLELRLDDTLEDDARLSSDLPICLDLPKLYFSGTSQGHESRNHTAVIAIRGFTALAPGGRQVRWRFIIR